MVIGKLKFTKLDGIATVVLIIFYVSCLIGIFLQGNMFEFWFCFIIGLFAAICGTWIFWLMVYRTLVMDENGCTFIVYKYKRTYRWDELSIKRIERNYSGASARYKNGVFFSLNPVEKSKTSDPFYYCLFVHPFTTFWVYLLQPGLSWQKGTDEQWCAVEEEKFLKQMKEWGVELTED